jgi:hypothetical protein
VNLMVLVDGSESIRSSAYVNDEWTETLDFVVKIGEKMRLGHNDYGPDYFTFVQFADDTKDHILMETISSPESFSALRGQIKSAKQLNSGSNTYNAVEHMLNLKSEDGPIDVLVIVTDGEARDHDHNRILYRLQNEFEFVVPVFVGSGPLPQSIRGFKGIYETGVMQIDAFSDEVVVKILEQINEMYEGNQNDFDRNRRHIMSRRYNAHHDGPHDAHHDGPHDAHHDGPHDQHHGGPHNQSRRLESESPSQLHYHFIKK